MLAQQILDDVRRELLEYGTQNFWSDAELLRLLNRAEMDFANRTRLLEDSAQLTLEQGRTDYPLPQNCFSVRLVFHNQVLDDGTQNWKRIYPSNLEKIAQENPDFLDRSINHQDRPRKYYIWNNTLNVVPAPDALDASQIVIFYKAKPIPITDPNSESINIDDSLADGLTAFVLWKAWQKEKENDMAEDNKKTYFEYVGEGRRWLKKKAGDERKRLDIDSPYGISMGRTGFTPFK